MKHYAIIFGPVVLAILAPLLVPGPWWVRVLAAVAGFVVGAAISARMIEGSRAGRDGGR